MSGLCSNSDGSTPAAEMMAFNPDMSPVGLLTVEEEEEEGASSNGAVVMRFILVQSLNWCPLVSCRETAATIVAVTIIIIIITIIIITI